MGVNIIGCVSSCILLHTVRQSGRFFHTHTQTQTHEQPHIIAANNKLQINCCCYTFFIAQLANCVLCTGKAWMKRRGKKTHLITFGSLFGIDNHDTVKIVPFFAVLPYHTCLSWVVTFLVPNKMAVSWETDALYTHNYQQPCSSSIPPHFSSSVPLSRLHTTNVRMFSTWKFEMNTYALVMVNAGLWLPFHFMCDRQTIQHCTAPTFTNV